MADVFISYKQDERERMRPLAEGLRALGVDVWFDERLQPDRAFTEEIQEVMGACRAQLVCWSPAAVKSEWVRGEAEMGRQRGVLIAVMVEQCELPPPFNMLHAQNLVGWTGEARHAGWRAVAEAVGRKLDRPGLGELAPLLDGGDADGWKRWAQKHPHDPMADMAWARAEELEIEATRARTAQQREAARRNAEEQARRAAATPKPPQAPPRDVPPPRGGGRSRLALAAMAVVGAAAAAAVAFVVAPRLDFGAAATTQIAQTEATESASATPAVAAAPGSSLATAALPSAEASVEAKGGPAAAMVATAPAAAASSVAIAAKQSDRGDADRALRALQRISGREWSIASSASLVRRVVEGGATIADVRAAANNDARAQTIMSYAYASGLAGVARDAAESFRYSQLAADQGFARAQSSLGSKYRSGLGVAPDQAVAVQWFRRGADQGNAVAQYNLGVQFTHGTGVTRDDVEAVRYYLLAANQGYANAQASMGFAYAGGRGVAANQYEAVRWYRLAANQGHATAQNNLALQYANGAGVTRDDNEAVRLYRLAVAQGNMPAHNGLGSMYENGRGVTADRAEAVRLYQIAAREGNEAAQSNLSRLGETW